MRHLVVAGTLLVDEVLGLAHPVTPGSQQRARARRVDGGGQVWHTALAAAQAGAAVVVTGRCGDDDDAARLRQRMRAVGVDVRLVPVGTSRRAVVLDVAGQERAIVSVAGDGRPLPPAAAVEAAGALAAAGWLHLDGYGLDDDSGDLLLALARQATAAGLPVSLEPPSVSGLPWRHERLAALPPLGLLVGRPEELDAVLPYLAAGPRVAVRHDGPRPVTWHDDAGVVTVAVPAGPFPATLGAGDRFTGGLLAALLGGSGPESALRAAVAAAAG